MQAPNVASAPPSKTGLYWNLGIATIGLLLGIVYSLGQLVFALGIGPDVSESLIDGVFEILFVAAFLGVAFAFTGIGAAWRHNLTMIAGVIQFILLADLYVIGLASIYYVGMVGCIGCSHTPAE